MCIFLRQPSGSSRASIFPGSNDETQVSDTLASAEHFNAFQKATQARETDILAATANDSWLMWACNETTFTCAHTHTCPHAQEKKAISFAEARRGSPTLCLLVLQLYTVTMFFWIPEMFVTGPLIAPRTFLLSVSLWPSMFRTRGNTCSLSS